MPGIDQTKQFVPLKIAVLTVSDTRSMADDKSGTTLVERIESAGHHVAARAIVTDDADAIRERVKAWIADPGIDVVITTSERPSEHFRPGPEHRRILRLCRRPTPVVDLTSEIDLPLGVVRVLLGDLTGEGMLRVVSTQKQPATDERLLRMVLDGLESL